VVDEEAKRMFEAERREFEAAENAKRVAEETYKRLMVRYLISQASPEDAKALNTLLE